jgi:hypothetical protein
MDASLILIVRWVTFASEVTAYLQNASPIQIVHPVKYARVDCVFLLNVMRILIAHLGRYAISEGAYPVHVEAIRAIRGFPEFAHRVQHGVRKTVQSYADRISSHPMRYAMDLTTTVTVRSMRFHPVLDAPTGKEKGSLTYLHSLT